MSLAFRVQIPTKKLIGEENAVNTGKGMKCGHCGQDNRERARFCDACGTPFRLTESKARSANVRECVSCGQMMDLDVYFTVCPHCGFNYRIEISPMKYGPGTSRGIVMLLYGASAFIPVAGFIFGAIYTKGSDPPTRRLAKNCFALGILNTVIVPILLIESMGWA